MCSSIGIMDHGKLAAAGRIEDITEGVFGGNQLVITLEEGRETALRMARENPRVKLESAGEQEIRLSHTMTKQEIAKLIGEMIAQGVVVTGFHKQEGNLETLFMSVTGKTARKGETEHASESNC